MKNKLKFASAFLLLSSSVYTKPIDDKPLLWGNYKPPFFKLARSDLYTTDLSTTPQGYLEGIDSVQKRIEEIKQSIPKPPKTLKEYLDRGNPFTTQLPHLFGSLPLVDLMNTIAAGSFFQDRMKKVLLQPKAFKQFNSLNEVNFWIEPFVSKGAFKTSLDTRFSLFTFGASLGGSYRVADSIFIGLGAGAFHSKVDWQRSLDDKGFTNTLFGGPFVAYSTEKALAAVSALIFRNDYHLKRRAEFPSGPSTSTAIVESDPLSWDLDLKAEGAFDFEVSELNSVYIKPNVSVDFVSVFEEEYGEKEGSAEVFRVKSSYSSFFTSKLGFEMRVEYFEKNLGYYIPSINLGWALKTPISKADYKTTSGDAVVKDYHTTSELFVGSSLTLIHKRAVSLSIGLEAYIFGKCPQGTGFLRLEWDW